MKCFLNAGRYAEIILFLAVLITTSCTTRPKAEDATEEVAQLVEEYSSSETEEEEIVDEKEEIFKMVSLELGLDEDRRVDYCSDIQELANKNEVLVLITENNETQFFDSYLCIWDKELREVAKRVNERWPQYDYAIFMERIYISDTNFELTPEITAFEIMHEKLDTRDEYPDGLRTHLFIPQGDSLVMILDRFWKLSYETESEKDKIKKTETWQEFTEIVQNSELKGMPDIVFNTFQEIVHLNMDGDELHREVTERVDTLIYNENRYH